MDDPVENGVQNGVSDDHTGEHGSGGMDRGEEQEKQVKPEKVVKKIRVTYEEYRTIANLLILHLRQLEEASEGSSHDHNMMSCVDHMIPHVGEEGTRQGDLVNWYLGEIEGEIDSVEMLAEKKVLVEKVIERLVQHVSCHRGHVILCHMTCLVLTVICL